MTLLVLLAVVGFFVYRISTPDDRARLVKTAVATAAHLRAAAMKPRPDYDGFRAALRARRPRVLLAPVLVGLNAFVFARMLFGAGSLSDPATLIGWGASFGPRTTNGEWWRLLTSAFVHTGVLQTLVNLALMAQLAWMLERLVGAFVVGSVYLSAALFAGLLGVSLRPIAVTGSASPPVYALLGLFLACCAWAMRPAAPQSDDSESGLTGEQESGLSGEQESGLSGADAGAAIDSRMRLTIPWRAATRLAPALILFVLYNLANGDAAASAEWTAFLIGLSAGLFLAKDVRESDAAPVRLVAIMTAAALVIAAGAAIPLRGIADVRPEIAHVVAVEERTAAAYRGAMERAKKGRMTAEALAQVIERTIVPELEASDTRLKSVRGVPSEQQPLVATAEEYLRLRQESWRLRAEGLRSGNKIPGREGKAKGETLSDASWRMKAEAQFRSTQASRGKAEAAERASLEILERIKPEGR